MGFYQWVIKNLIVFVACMVLVHIYGPLLTDAIFSSQNFGNLSHCDCGAELLHLETSEQFYTEKHQKKKTFKDSAKLLTLT